MGLFFNFYIMFRTVLDFIIDYIFGLYFNSNRKFLPKITNKILLESGTSLARKIRKKELTSEEIVQAFIDRINEVNDILNAVVDNRFEEALAEAKQIDADIKAGKITESDFEKKTFLGVPFTSKESTACKGLSFTFGLICRKGAKATQDAAVIESMKGAGGILLAVTNIPQLNLWCETYNPLFGVTSNPYNTTKNVGGSSGGEASIIAACGSAIGIGTDIGGSIRIPAFRCGIFGHKASHEIISTRGLTFREGTEGPTMVTSGPMSKHSEDLLPLLKVLVGKSEKVNLDEEINLRNINVFYMSTTKCLRSSPISNEIIAAVNRCARHFENVCVSRPEEIKLDDTKYAFSIWSYMRTKENSNYTWDITDRKEEAKWYKEGLRYLFRMSEYNLYTIYNLINGILPKPNPKWGEEVTNRLTKDLLAKLGTNGVLIFPPEAFPASYHYTSLLRPFNFGHYSLWNALKFPVTQVPLGLNKDGMPLGVQIVAAPYRDHLTIAVATELERAFGGYVPPVKVETAEVSI